MNGLETYNRWKGGGQNQKKQIMRERIMELFLFVRFNMAHILNFNLKLILSFSV